MRAELYPLLWKNWQKSSRANVYFVAAIHNASGITPPVGWGRGAAIDCGSAPDVNRASDVLAHELGHYMGISRHKSKKDPSNLMTRSGATSSGMLTNKQVEEIHKTLSTNVLRRTVRGP